jgi:hypothetical protein
MTVEDIYYCSLRWEKLHVTQGLMEWLDLCFSAVHEQEYFFGDLRFGPEHRVGSACLRWLVFRQQ